MNSRSWIGLTLVIVGVALWSWFRFIQPDIDAEAAARQAFAAQAAPPASAAGTTPVTPAPEERSTLADALNAPSGDIRADLRIVADILETFRTNFLRDGNPVGNNAEITAALIGKNKLRHAFVPRDHPAINRDGELCDRWGTPFFFHAESATRMEIRSAGPDKKMWSPDDVTFAP